VRAKHREIASYAFARLALTVDGGNCVPQVDEHLIDRHSDGAYAVIRFSARCGAPIGTLSTTYRLFFELDPQHRGLLQLNYKGRVRSAIFAADTAAQRFDLSQATPLRQFGEYLRHGVWHIWTGFDHLLFLLSLLLPSVLLLTGRQWEPAPDWRRAVWDVTKVVTAFTLAHSITLSMAALKMLSLSSRLAESAIAASVVMAAANNLKPIVTQRRWMIAFAFGLIHGFGFASVLADLGLPEGALLLCLVAFNLGVELGQLAVVGVFFPVAWLIREHWVYRRLVMTAGSAIIILLASIWLLERSLNLKLLT
jgi:hypothetical protein